MTNNDLIHANNLKDKINYLEKFILEVKSNWCIRIFNRTIKKRHRDKIGVVISDYMRPYFYYELTKEQREKLIKILEEDLEQYKKEFENMGNF